MQRLDEAVAASQRAVELNPLSPCMHWRLGCMFYVLQRWDRAIEQCRHALDLDPRDGPAVGYLARSYLWTSKFDEAIQGMETFAQIHGHSPQALGWLGFASARAGRIGDARKLLADLQYLAQGIYVPPSSFAWICAGLGESHKAFDHWEDAADMRDPWILHIQV
jgi:tetratricopeptide (TPR) repeat protein